MLEVRPDEAGRRLDLFLADRLRLSRAQTRRLLARGAVRVDGSIAPAAAKGAPVASGARVAVEPFTRPEQQRALAQPELPLSVLAEGPGWLAVVCPECQPQVELLPPAQREAILSLRQRILALGEPRELARLTRDPELREQVQQADALLESLSQRAGTHRALAELA